VKRKEETGETGFELERRIGHSHIYALKGVINHTHQYHTH